MSRPSAWALFGLILGASTFATKRAVHMSRPSAWALFGLILGASTVATKRAFHMSRPSAWALFGLVLGAMACSGGTSSSKGEGSKEKKLATLSLHKKKVTRGDILKLHARSSRPIQGLRLQLDDTLLTADKDSVLSFSTLSMNLGHQKLRAEVCLGDSLWESHSLKVQVLASSAPKEYVYFLQARYPHDEEAYTQGLFFDRGFLYEGTGQKGKSYLQQRRWPSGEVLRTVHLDDQFFGEGIAMKGDRVYQLTWMSHTCLIYDRETLKQIEKIQYPTEGWGLTSWKEYLVMSDGSEYLYFYRTDPWQYDHSLQVYDHQGSVSGINELETVNNLIYANQYEKDTLLIIDPYHGSLLGTVDVSGLFDAEAYADRTGKEVDVLNGIAYDSISDHFILTGKLWPYMYEILVASKENP